LTRHIVCFAQVSYINYVDVRSCEPYTSSHVEIEDQKCGGHLRWKNKDRMGCSSARTISSVGKTAKITAEMTDNYTGI